MENEVRKAIKKYFSKLGLMYFIGAIVIIVVQLIAALSVKAAAPEVMENYDISFIISMLPMYLIGYPVMAALIHTVPAAKLTTEKKKMTIGQWFIAFMMCYACLYVSNIVGMILTTVIGIFKQGVVQNTIVNVATSVHPLTAFVIMVICAPIAEEFIFRKLLIDRAVKYGEGVAILLSGAMFGLFHGNLNQFVYAFTMGCFLAFIYIRTRNIWYSISLHMVINFMGSVLGLFVLKKSGYMELAAALEAASPEEITQLVMTNISGLAILMIYAVALMVIVFAGIILMILRRKKFYINRTEEELVKGQRFAAVALNVGMLLYSIFWIVQIIVQLFQ